MAKSAHNIAIEERALALALSVNTILFIDENDSFRRYAKQQHPSLRRKLIALSASCQRMHMLHSPKVFRYALR